MYIIVGPSLCFGFDLKHGSKKQINEIKHELRDFIDYFKSQVFADANIIHKDKLTIDTISGTMNEVLEYYDIEYLKDEIITLITEVYDNSEVNEIPVNSIIAKVTKFCNDAKIFS